MEEPGGVHSARKFARSMLALYGFRLGEAYRLNDKLVALVSVIYDETKNWEDWVATVRAVGVTRAANHSVRLGALKLIQEEPEDGK